MMNKNLFHMLYVVTTYSRYKLMGLSIFLEYLVQIEGV